MRRGRLPCRREEGMGGWARMSRNRKDSGSRAAAPIVGGSVSEASALVRGGADRGRQCKRGLGARHAREKGRVPWKVLSCTAQSGVGNSYCDDGSALAPPLWRAEHRAGAENATTSWRMGLSACAQDSPQSPRAGPRAAPRGLTVAVPSEVPRRPLGTSQGKAERAAQAQT